VSDPTLQRNLESLEQKYVHLIGSAQNHISYLENQASELKLKAISQEAAMNQLQDNCENLTSNCENLTSLNAILREEVDCLKSQNSNQLSDLQCEKEFLLLQLRQVMEELEHYFLENQRKDEKLRWLRGQRELLLRMLRLQGRFQQRFLALDGRIALPYLRRQLMPWWQRLQRS